MKIFKERIALVGTCIDKVAREISELGRLLKKYALEEKTVNVFPECVFLLISKRQWEIGQDTEEDQLHALHIKNIALQRVFDFDGQVLPSTYAQIELNLGRLSGLTLLVSYREDGGSLAIDDRNADDYFTEEDRIEHVSYFLPKKLSECLVKKKGAPISISDARISELLNHMLSQTSQLPKMLR